MRLALPPVGSTNLATAPFAALALALLPTPPASAAEELPSVQGAVRSSQQPDWKGTPKPVSLILNGAPDGEPCLVSLQDRQIFVRREDLAQRGIAPQDGATDMVIGGQGYIALDTVAGLTAKLDKTGETLIIEADPKVFPAVRYGRRQSRAAPSEIVPAQFIGYDLSVLDWNGEVSATAYIDAGFSGSWGLFGTTVIAQTGEVGVVRLESALQRDFPDQRLRLVIGDTVTRGAEWNRPARFAGIRVGTDFSLNPEEITYPLPALAGAASLPSTVELAAAGSAQSIAVQPGNFVIDYQPVFSGAGEVTMTIRDPAGNAHRVTQNFYSSPRLLRPGLDDFSFEAGFLREDFGRRSFSYGDPFAAAYWRHGLTPFLTVAGRGEASPVTRMGGLGFGLVLTPLGELSLSGALSEGNFGTGSLWRAQFQRLSRLYSVTVSYQRASANFAQVGDADETFSGPGSARTELAVAGSLSLGRYGSINASYLDATRRDQTRFRMESLSYATNFGLAYISVGARRTEFAQSRDTGLFGSLSMPLGGRRTASASVDDEHLIQTVQQTPPNDQGFGYRAEAGVNTKTGDALLGASGTLRTRAGDIELSARKNEGGQGVRLSARGALVAINGKVSATPRLDYAFAAITVDSDEDVTLYYEHRPVAVKARKGHTAILTGLQPYAPNHVSIDVDALPIDAQVSSAEKVAVPGYRQAAGISFGGAQSKPATLKLTDERGNALAAGLTVALPDGSTSLTGLGGEVFIANLAGGERIMVKSQGAVCVAQVPRKVQTGPDAKIAPLACRKYNGKDD